jgi:hypothetical protein
MTSPIKALPVSVYRVFFLVFWVLLPFSAAAQSVRPVLWANEYGLYSRDQAGRTEVVWSEGKVRKIIPLGQGSSWALLADNGIWVSENLRNWEKRSKGLPEKTLKIYENKKKSLITEIQDIKDLEADPANRDIMVCAIKNAVYLSQNGGRSWESLGMPNYRSNGIKAVAVTSMPELTVFCAHSIYGVYYINPKAQGAKWIEISGGLEKLETTDNPDEVSDIAVALDSSGSVAIYASQSFRPRLYKLDWASKSWNLLWSSGAAFGPVDSLQPGRSSLTFVRDSGVFSLQLNVANAAIYYRQDLTEAIDILPGKASCAVFTGSETICLSELWLMSERSSVEHSSTQNRQVSFNTVSQEANDKEGLYLPVNHAMDPGSLRPYLQTIESRKLNMVVIDMKDDYGRLRFTPNDPSMLNLGRIFRPVDIDAFLKTMKERGIYTVARIVVFKDPEAARKEGEKYAVWDGVTNKAWEGYYDTRRKKTNGAEETDSAHVTAILPANDPDYEILRTWYDEKWVDPYSEVIWDYNASVAEELCRRGFDEIQFDYIRFPTDGINLDNARYRWRDSGMDMDSAIESFLRYARSRISKPISLDIYGANGWYRTGARTGQEVEILYKYVDVICPMYYPSHFEQTFLAQNPPEDRPYRIYYFGTQRTHIIARGRVIVRPWAQAFYLNVSYDRKYYNIDYVRKQLEGVRGAGRGGLTYWNNSGRYEDIP